MSRSLRCRVGLLERKRRPLDPRFVDVHILKDEELEVVIGIPGFIAALDRMTPTQEKRIFELVALGTTDAWTEVEASVAAYRTTD